MAESPNPVEDLGRITLHTLAKLDEVTRNIFRLKNTQIEENGIATEARTLMNVLTPLSNELNDIYDRLRIRCVLEGLPYESSETSTLAPQPTTPSTSRNEQQLQSSLRTPPPPLPPTSAPIPTNLLSFPTPPPSPLTPSPLSLPSLSPTSLSPSELPPLDILFASSPPSTPPVSPSP